MSDPMTDDWGIDHTYVDAAGTEHAIDPDIIEATRQLVGRPPLAWRPPIVTRQGELVDAGHGTLVLENGDAIAIDGTIPADAPLGYHALHDEVGVRDVIISPGRCHRADRRAWGWAVQLYAARSARSWGMGDLRDLADLATWSRDELGAGFALVNPMHATALTSPIQPSPYYPASRCFRSPLYLSIDDIPGAAETHDAWIDHARRAQALNDRPDVDRDTVWRHKAAALTIIWEHVRTNDAAFRAWLRSQPDALRSFATWCVLTEDSQTSWRGWPEELRDPSSPAVTHVGEANRDRVEFHMWLQWCLARQLDEVASTTALIQDLPIGFDPGGFDAWRWQAVVADGASIGAPPDEFNTRGQDWGLPPFVPWRLRAAGYRPLIEALRATMSGGGGIRIDHVMGLFRLWWVPRGGSPTDGAYVRYPADEMLDVLALESHRAGAMVVGEDLGTVEAGVREELASRNVLSYRLLWFEEGHPDEWPARSMAAVTTHDLPTVLGLWSGDDTDEQRKLGLEPNEDAVGSIRDRVARDAGLTDAAEPAAVVVGAYRLLGGSPSVLVSASLDDVALAVERPNMPGADGVRPNWSIALRPSLDDLRRAPQTRRVAEALAATVHGDAPAATPPTTASGGDRGDGSRPS